MGAERARLCNSRVNLMLLLVTHNAAFNVGFGIIIVSMFVPFGFR